MKILIVEDDYWQANEMKAWLTEEGFTVVGVVKSGEEALGILDEHQPDLMIVDIELKGKINNGIDLMRRVQKKHSMAFFYLTSDSVTSYYEKARGTNPQAYLTKAEVFTKKSLLRNVDLALHNYTLSEQKDQRQMVDNAIFVLDNNDMYVKLPIPEIGWLEAQGAYTRIVMTDTKSYTVSKNLSTMMSRIDSPQFVRINQSYSVNIYNVSGFKGKQVQVSGKLLPKSISDKYCPDFVGYVRKI